MKKIGLYIPHLSNGGAERVVSRMSKIMSKKYEIYIIINEEKISYEVEGNIINLNVKSTYNPIKKILLPILRSYKLRKLKNELDLDFTISFLTSANIVNCLSKTKYDKIAVSVRNFSDFEKNRSKLDKIKDQIMKNLYNKADFIIPVSVEIERSLIKNYGIDKEKIVTIYNPYDIDEIKNLSMQKINNNKHIDFLNSGKVFVTMGRLTYQKGYWHLLKSISSIPNDYNIKLLIIGEGKDYSKIEKMIAELKLEEKVLMIGYEENPFKYLSKCYGYILSSLFEGFPNAMVEAMSCGCPVIAVDCKSGPREILYEELDLDRNIINVEYADYGIISPMLSMNENWDCGILDKEELFLAEAIKMLANDNEMRDVLRSKSMKRALSFSNKAYLQKYIHIIEGS